MAESRESVSVESVAAIRVGNDRPAKLSMGPQHVVVPLSPLRVRPCGVAGGRVGKSRLCLRAETSRPRFRYQS